ncbi:hypothetical protein [Vibrio sp. 10N.239.312.D08]|uniref:hypothetical protein n=1 Tax=Vibrio sp. 10N.239.312.D08 TaxID=3229978 RepID=UPI00354EAD77
MKFISKTIMCICLGTSVLIASNSHASTELVSEHISEVRTTEYQSNASIPLRQIKVEAREQLIRETLDILPTYMLSNQTVTDNNYSESLRFVGAAYIKVTNEDYDVSFVDDLVTIKLQATVQFDTNEIQRKVREIEANEHRNKLVTAVSSETSALSDQVENITRLYKFKVPSSKLLKSDIDVLTHKFVNLPLGDMVEEFELEKELEEIQAQLESEKERNAEWLSLDANERNEYAANLEVGALINRAYMDQIKRPLHLVVTNVTKNDVYLRVQPIEGMPNFMPWYISHHKDAAKLAEKFSDNVFSMQFLNGSCSSSKYEQMPNKTWYELLNRGFNVERDRYKRLTLSKDGAMIEGRFSPDDNVPLKNASLKTSQLFDYGYSVEFPSLNEYIPGYQSPVFINTVPNVNMNKRVFASMPIGVDWMLTTDELEKGYQMGNQPVPVWGVEFILNGKKITKPLITRQDGDRNAMAFRSKTAKFKIEQNNNEMRKFKPYIDSAFNSAWIMKEIKNGAKYRQFEHIWPYRTTGVKCGVQMKTAYPQIKISREEAHNLSDVEINVFRY